MSSKPRTFGILKLAVVIITSLLIGLAVIAPRIGVPYTDPSMVHRCLTGKFLAEQIEGYTQPDDQELDLYSFVERVARTRASLSVSRSGQPCKDGFAFHFCPAGFASKEPGALIAFTGAIDQGEWEDHRCVLVWTDAGTEKSQIDVRVMGITPPTWRSEYAPDAEMEQTVSIYYCRD